MSAIEPRATNPIDDHILRLAGVYSPNEISAQLKGVVSPGKVASRVQTLLKARNWLTVTQERLLITWRLKDLLRQIEERGLTDDNAKLRISLYKELAVQLEKTDKATTADLTTYHRNQGIIMGQVVDQALAYMKGALRDEVEPAKWDALLQEAMYSAQLEIARHETIEE